MKAKYLLLIPILALTQSCMVSEKSVVDKETAQTATIMKVSVPRMMMKAVLLGTKNNGDMSSDEWRLIKRIKGVKVLTVENAAPRLLRKISRDAFGDNREELLSVKHEDGRISVSCAAHMPDGVVKDLFITVNDGSDVVLVKVRGKFPMDDVARIANQ